MKKLICMVIVSVVLVSAQMSGACVGKTLFIGIPDSANEKLLAEMVSVLINERTGTAVKIQVYKDSSELYTAVKQGQVSILIENAEHALEVLHKPKESVAKAAFDMVKSEYRKNLNLVWLEPFAGTQQYGTVLTVETLANYPALPRLINKLSGTMTSDAYAKLLKSLRGDENQKKLARDFLKAKKLI